MKFFWEQKSATDAVVWNTAAVEHDTRPNDQDQNFAPLADDRAVSHHNNDLLIFNNGDGSDYLEHHNNDLLIFKNGGTSDDIEGDNHDLLIFNNGDGSDFLEREANNNGREDSGLKFFPNPEEGGGVQELDYESPIIDPWTHQGTSEADLMVGSDANETFFGHHGGDLVSAGNGNDTVFGEGGEDTLIGGEGDDVLWGGALSDELTGGNGADTFGFVQEYLFVHGTDIITDFEVGKDALAFDDNFLDVAPGEALHDNLIALDGENGVELWADTNLSSLAHIATLEGVTAAEIQPLIDSEMILA